MDPAAQVGIGPTIHVKGDVTAQEPLIIAGRLEGTVQVDGHPVTVSPGGSVTASITADTIVIGGVVHGRSEAGRRIIVRETAEVEGDLIAPTISFADGATVRGRVETAARPAATLPLAS